MALQCRARNCRSGLFAPTAMMMCWRTINLLLGGLRNRQGPVSERSHRVPGRSASAGSSGWRRLAAEARWSITEGALSQAFDNGSGGVVLGVRPCGATRPASRNNEIAPYFGKDTLGGENGMLSAAMSGPAATLRAWRAESDGGCRRESPAAGAAAARLTETHFYSCILFTFCLLLSAGGSSHAGTAKALGIPPPGRP
jgi:hypothetical protein